VAGNAQVALSWSKPFNDGGSAVTGYAVLWREGTSVNPTEVPLGATTTSYTVSGLVNGGLYQFGVEATNSSGTGPTGAWATSYPTADSPPRAPTIKGASVKSVGFGVNGKVDLSWSKPVPGGCGSSSCAISGYTVTYDEYVIETDNHGHKSTQLEPVSKSVVAAATSVDLSLPLDFRSYVFDLAAQNSYGSSPRAEVSVVLELAPQAPVVTAVPGAGEVTLSWLEHPTSDARQGIGGITAHEVYEGTSSRNEAPTPLPSSQLRTQTVPESNHGVPVSAVTVTVMGLNAQTKYYFEVADMDADGLGPKSVEVSATTLSGPGP
jgi:hypothetical protein